MAMGQHIKLLLVLLAFACCASRVSAQSSNTTTTCLTVLASNFTAPTGLSTFQIDYPTELDNYIKFEFYATAGNIEVDVEWCSNDASLIETFKSLIANVTNQVDRVLLNLGLTSTGQLSPATRVNVAFPLAILTAVLASVFLLPNSRITGALVLCAICIALCTPTFAYTTMNVVTVRIGLPSQITRVCENSNCFGWTTSTSSSTTSSTTSTPVTTGATTAASSTSGDATPAPSTSSATTSLPVTTGDTTATSATSGDATSASVTSGAATSTSATTSGDTTASSTTSSATSSVPTDVPTSTASTTAASITGASTTNASTTVAPTTDASTTDASTTAAPTTAAPTTAVSTSGTSTVASITGASTTDASTTVAPTTDASTTAASTTNASTTDASTTATSITGASTTDTSTTASTAAASVTGASTTDASTTAASVTGASTTDASTTAASIAAASATAASTTVASTTGASVTGASTTGTPTTGTPTAAPASLYFKLKVLILANIKKTSLGADFATLAFDSVGMPYDFVTVTASVALSSYLSTDGVGSYSGIVSVYSASGVDPLSDAQNALVVAYQKKYGVRWAIVSAVSTSKTIPGVSIAKTAITNQYYQVTLAPEAAQYGQFLNQDISVNTRDTILWSDYTNTPCTLLNVQITDPSIATPVLIAHPTSGQSVAAATFKNADGTEQLRYFMTEGADYIHSMAFSNLLTNWISPGGLFIGIRRLIFTVQPDDLFLGSYVWNITTHSNPVTADAFFYRITADDLQTLADFFDHVNPLLPAGSYVTVEWPTNFGGVDNSYYLKGAPVDDLYNKAVQLIDKFYYLSHTWDHPCPGAAGGDFDTDDTAAGYALATTELSKNIDYVPNFFGNKQHLWSNFSMITPCVTGLYNAGVLRAMNENGITACVSDESVESSEIDYEPIVPYHGQYSTVARNGREGVYFVPRQTLDIDYCARTPADCLDQYQTERTKQDPVYTTFEEFMVQERMLAIGLMAAFRWDPYMMHQTNAMKFTYNDPTPNPLFGLGSSYSTSLVALWMQRVMGDILQYYNLPIVTKQMDDLTNMFLQRQTMDGCGINAVLGVNSANQIVDISISSAAKCQMTLSGGAVLSGSTVEMEVVGVETTAYINLSGKSDETQHFTLATPIARN